MASVPSICSNHHIVGSTSWHCISPQFITVAPLPTRFLISLRVSFNLFEKCTAVLTSSNRLLLMFDLLVMSSTSSLYRMHDRYIGIDVC
eukprot:17698-Heterococcus_DN1.PRE.2